MKANTFSHAITPDVLSAYVQKVYAWMVGGLIITSLTALGVSSSPEILAAVFGTPLRWVVMLGPLAMVWILASRVDNMKPSTAAGMFIGFSALIGVSLSSIFVVYELGSIFQVFLIAAGMYGTAAVYGFVTKRDLTGMGSFLFMGLIGIILASVVNIFMNSGALDWAISLIGVAIFTGLTAYDMQRIKDQAIVMYAGNELATKRSILSALSLYLNFINLFLFLLRMLGSRR
ncbi:MAG: Bax inhibitor-1/YccA family protein [Ignavibacteria bacterium]|nr:Bax inhibitor-1/YccA family protein [Ignavibacteria bacterium]